MRISIKCGTHCSKPLGYKFVAALMATVKGQTPESQSKNSCPAIGDNQVRASKKARQLYGPRIDDRQSIHTFSSRPRGQRSRFQTPLPTRLVNSTRAVRRNGPTTTWIKLLHSRETSCVCVAQIAQTCAKRL